MTHPTQATLVLACPEDLRADANALAMALGQGPGCGHSFPPAAWTGPDGTAYAVMATEAARPWQAAAETGRPGARPAWDAGPPYAVNMTGAARAASRLRAGPGGPARADALVAVAAPTARAALAALGLVPRVGGDDA